MRSYTSQCERVTRGFGWCRGKRCQRSVDCDGGLHAGIASSRGERAVQLSLANESHQRLAHPTHGQDTTILGPCTASRR
jgi:hypothetical protein